LASLGQLLGLERLSLRGCRGDRRETERAVWEAIASHRSEQPIAYAKVLEARAQARLDRSDALLRQVRALRDEASRTLERARIVREAHNGKGRKNRDR